MFVDLETNLKSKRKNWGQRLLNRKPRNPYHETDKASTTCKCPKCGMCHESFIHWTGRGTPRIYCKDCRSHLSSRSDISQDYAVTLGTYGSQKKAGHCIE